MFCGRLDGSEPVDVAGLRAEFSPAVAGFAGAGPLPPSAPSSLKSSAFSASFLGTGWLGAVVPSPAYV